MTETPRRSYWSGSNQELLALLKTGENGLSVREATARLSQTQKLGGRRRSAAKLLLDQFKSPIIVLLFCSAVLTFSLAYYDATSAGQRFSITDAPDGCIIVFILLTSGLLGFWQELSAADAVAKLVGLIQTKARVLRDGVASDVALNDVVPGDVICLSAGTIIPGDCRLLSAQDLFVNEAALTGESFPIEKCVAEMSAETPLSQRINSVHLGTHVVSGVGRAVVAYTGRETELGQISVRLESKPPETGFERGIRQFGQLLIKIVVVITVVVFGVKVGLQDRPLVDSLLVGLALAVGMTPQLLPAVTSVVLAAGAKAMAKRQVIVKQLLSIENLGNMTVLCSDKTGTLTEGKIDLHAALDLDGSPSEVVLWLAYLNASLQTGFSNPIDRAIRESADRSSSIEEARRAGQVCKIDEVPYDFVRKRLSVRIEQAGKKLLITKGAFAQVLACCTRLDEQTRCALETRYKAMSDEGLRILGLAIKECHQPQITKEDESEMTFVGFLAFADPPKADAQETIRHLRELGVAFKIITGDNRLVAASISRRVGMESPNIVTGAEVRTLNDSDLRQRAQEADIFAEVEPNQKERIILALKRSGQVVGYLGDGINDASALHAADVGISVSGAVDVAKEAAQVVLLKQDLGVLVQGVIEGRRTFSNTLKYVFFAIAANFGYMFSLAVASLFLSFEPLLASQILLVNLLADFPAMALATDNVDSEQIAKPRRWDTRFILRFMMSFGLASSCFDFLTFGTIYWLFKGLYSGDPEDFEKLFQTGWFIESTLTGLVILMVIRTQRPLLLSKPGRLFMITVLCVAIVTVYIPFSPFAKLMGFVRPTGTLLLVTIGIAGLYAVGMELVKRFFYRHLATRDYPR